MTDALLHPVVEGLASTPPSTPLNGACWIVDANPTGAFADLTDQIACNVDGQWLFAAPVEGMIVFDRTLGQIRTF